MLPFLKKQVKHQSGLLMKTRPSDMPSEESDSDLDKYAKDLVDAVHTNDIQGVSAALKAAFACLELAPHEEGPHINESEEQE